MNKGETILFWIENAAIGLRQYTHDDDHDMYLCWLDAGTQKGYNTTFDLSFDQFKKQDISRFRFWVTIISKLTNESIGTLRLGPDEHCPDLAVWIYPQFRNQGFGTQAFQLALQYLFEKYHYPEISAGCYCDNTASLKMLKKIGFIRYPDCDRKEPDCFTGEETTQLEFRVTKSLLNG